MLISIDWLKRYVHIPWSIEELADRLTATGIKVEAIMPAPEVSGVVTGRIVAMEPHPTSDTNLQVCQIDIGGGQTVQSVTGAPNARVGLVVPVALPGAKLPGIDGNIVATQMAGIESAAVLCSEMELGISDNHDGLMSLPTDVEIGEDIHDVLILDDVVLEIETYPNRPDCLSVIGIAREVAAITGESIQMPNETVRESSSIAIDEHASVRVDDPELCPRYTARLIKDVKIKPSPLWMQQRLRSVGIRPINNVVDVTNYCLMEYGQPMHAFDYEKITDGQIIVRRAKPGETIFTLDGNEHDLDEDMLLICDAQGPVALAGIMGGLDSEVTDQTKDVLLESATFDPTSIRKTCKKLGIRTESSHRFERDLDPHLSGIAIERAASLIAELSGGTVAEGRIDVKDTLPQPVKLTCRAQRVNQMLGTKISPVEMKRILCGLGFHVDIGKSGTKLEVQVPTFRRDIEHEADIAEEIARLYGYDQIPSTFPFGETVLGQRMAPLPTIKQIGETLKASGCYEAVTYSFISPKWFDWLNLDPEDEMRQAIRIQNPISEEMSVMRTALFPSLLAAGGTNARRQVEDVRLFEIGKRYIPTEWPAESLPEENDTLAVLMFGQAVTDVWGSPSRNVDFYDIKGVIESVGETVDVDLQFSSTTHPAFHPGRTAAVFAGDVHLGFIGEIHPEVAARFDIKQRAYAGEIWLDRLFQVKDRPFEYTPIPRFPAVHRDFALLVPESVQAADITRIIQSQGGDHLTDVSLFDVYEGDQIPDGFRSLAFTMVYQAGDRTLTDEEINDAQQRIEKALETELNVKVRG